MHTIKVFITKIITILLLLALLAGSFGCNNGTKYITSNTFVENQDYQYSFSGSSTGNITVQKGNNGYYFSLNNFLYFVDEKTLNATPLCNKVNCLHDKETDQSKLAECNAYLSDNLLNTDYYFINKKLYKLIDESYFEGNKLIVINSIYEAQSDGTQSKKIFSINKQIKRWIMHRGMIYYTTDANSNVESYSLESQNTKVCFNLDNLGLYNPELSNMIAYENNMYYCVSGYKDEKEFNDMLDGADISPFEYIFIYTPDGEEEYTLSSKLSRNGIVFQGFLDDNMLYTDADYDEKVKNLYLFDKNGKSIKLNYKFKNIYDLYYEDDSFVYIRSAKTIDDIERNEYDVYDKKGNYITSIDFPDGFSNEFFMGDNKYLFYLENSEQGTNLFCIDKGNLKNGYAELKIIYSKN